MTPTKVKPKREPGTKRIYYRKGAATEDIRNRSSII